MNLLQVRRILDAFLNDAQDDPDDIATFTDHAVRCVTSTPEEFVAPPQLLRLLGQVVAVMASWDWQADPALPQLADDESWWGDPAWGPVRALFADARRLLPPVGVAEQQELDRQAGR